MDEPLEESYFNWLCAKVRQNPAPDYLSLFRILHTTEFTWVVMLDRNRAADGRELREYYCTEAYIKRIPSWFQEPCSIFEMLIALCGHLQFQTDRPVKDWFWELITNLHLEDFRRVSKSDESIIDDILYTFVWREYEYSGEGGIFPLRNPRRDQRKVEIWYQFFDYLTDQGFM